MNAILDEEAAQGQRKKRSSGTYAGLQRNSNSKNVYNVTKKIFDELSKKPYISKSFIMPTMYNCSAQKAYSAEELVNLEGGFLLNSIYRREKVFFIIIIHGIEISYKEMSNELYCLKLILYYLYCFHAELNDLHLQVLYTNA